MKLKKLTIAIAMAIAVSGQALAFDSGSNYNTINMSYQANSTVTQNIVFNSAMQAGGTFDFSVNAHSGGGRPLQHDTGNVKLEFFTSSGALVTSSQTNYSQNLLQMNAWSSTAGDNSEPWITITHSYTLSASDAAQVSYVKLSLIGTDSSWWAGNYGAQWQMPTLTFNGGSTNILYNPEFGVAPDGVQAQGWTSSTGYSGVCGQTSGSAACVTSSTGVTANMSAGGYDPNGGTTSGSAGGYTGTLSATTILATINNGGVPPSGGGSSTPSGPVAVTNASGTTATNPSGTTTLTVTNDGTYTNDGTTGDVTNNASGVFTNNGTTGAVTNAGDFTNSSTGTTGNVTNSGTFNNAGTTGTVNNTGGFANNGTTGDVTNNGTFINGATGTTGAVTNAGSFNNYGSVTTVNNMGVFENKAGGTVNSLTYNNHVVRNYGTINSITYQGGSFTNYAGGIVGSINTTQAHGSFNNQGTITGDVTTNSSNFVNQSTGVVQGTYTNSGTLQNYGTLGLVVNSGTLTTYAGSTAGDVSNTGIVTNAGTIGNITSSGTFANSGTAGNVVVTAGTFTNTGTVASVDNTAGLTLVNDGTVTGTYTNAGDLTNNGSVGTVVNSGVLANNGTIGSLTNSGTFATNSTTLSSYTQTNTGSTTLAYGNSITVSGPASLDGNLTMIGTPYTVGRYNVLTGNGVTGAYSSYNGVGVLRYTDSAVQIWVMPDGTVVQGQVNALANNLSSVNSLAISSLTGGMSDCAVFGVNGACLSVNYGSSTVASGDLNSAGITAAKRINENWRAGVFLNQQLNSPTISSIKYDANTPSYGGFVGWNKDKLGVTVSAITGTGSYTIGENKPNVQGDAVQVKTTYTMPVTETVTVTPYAGVRYSQFKVNGYTTNDTFPLTYSAVNQKSTDLLAGLTVAKQFTDKLTGTVSLGATQNLNKRSNNVISTSDMGTYSAPLVVNKNTTIGVGTGLSYAVTKNQRVGVNVGWSEKQTGNITSYGVSYTVGF